MHPAKSTSQRLQKQDHRRVAGLADILYNAPLRSIMGYNHEHLTLDVFVANGEGNTAESCSSRDGRCGH